MNSGCRGVFLEIASPLGPWDRHDVWPPRQDPCKGNLTERVPGENEKTEIGRLAKTLNVMLTRIESAFSARVAEMYKNPDEAARQQAIRDMTAEIIDKAPYIWLPTPYNYTAWWPWVKNYEGELRVGAVKPGPVYARIWLDQAMKKQMGH